MLEAAQQIDYVQAHALGSKAELMLPESRVEYKEQLSGNGEGVYLARTSPLDTPSPADCSNARPVARAQGLY